MKRPKPTKLPKQIIVTVDNEGTPDQFLNVAESAHAAAEQGVVKRGGVYALQELITIEGVAKVSPAK